MRNALALPLVLLPGAALADVTPQDVWDNTVAVYGALGIEMMGTPTATVDGLTVEGAALRLTYPQAGGSATMTLPTLTLTDLGDGTVQVITPDTYVMELAADLPDGSGLMTADITLSQSGLSTVASGDPGDVTYTTDVASFDLLINNLTIPGEDITLDMQIDSDGYQSETRVNVADNITVTSAILNRAATTGFNITTGNSIQTSTGSGGEIATNATIVLPPDMNLMNLTPALLAGLSITGNSISAGSTGSSSATLDGQVISEQTQTIGSNTSDFALSQDGLSISGAVEAIEAVITEYQMMPFPIAVAMTGASANFAVPLVAMDDPQDFTYAIGLDGLTISDDIWSLIDGGNQLNRAPASLAIDVTGSLNWGLNLFDIASLMELEQSGAVPISINAATIRAFDLGILGAAAKATGSFTFDNTDMDTIPGMPRPEGAATVTATGINAAMDQLVAAGLLPEDQVGMARMMMGLFTRTTGDDALESTVELNAEGHLLVNGQRMR